MQVTESPIRMEIIKDLIMETNGQLFVSGDIMGKIGREYFWDIIQVITSMRDSGILDLVAHNSTFGYQVSASVPVFQLKTNKI